MASFGMRLKQEREKRAITLDDISLSTKISTRMLRALEEEHFDQLPGGIFNKGFIRAYARCLGMDEEQAIADYIAAISPPGKNSENDDQAPVLDPPSREPSPEENHGAAGVPWGMFAVALLIVALGFAAWGFYSRESEKGTPASAAPAANSPSQPPSDSGAATAQVAKASQPTVPSTAGGESSQTPAASPPASTPSQSSSQTPSSQAPRAGRFVVLIRAREDSWLSVSIDGEVSTHSTLTAPAEKSVRAGKEIIIKAGNIGALDFEFNGKKLPAQGGYGEVKTLTFDANGLRPPAPKPEDPAQSP
ncbi:MAG TPA: RodZ domain-containing protein [Terriglobales bacterium]|nr:RodZ domain-containing protein [Terriglobales bacterium]